MRKLLVVLVVALVAGCGNAGTTPSQSPSSSPKPTPSQSAPAQAKATVYFVSDTGTSLRLYSEQTEVDASNPTQGALAYLLSGAAPKDSDYSNLWPAGSKLNSVSIDGELATVDVSFDKLNVGAEAEGRALDQLLRTVVAANSEVTKVQFLRDGNKVESFAGHLDTTQPIAVDKGFDSLATVDIDLDEGDSLSSPVVITGLACTFEANVPWELKQDGKVINSGSTTAAEACPTRSPWSVDLRELPAGSYEFRTWESSMKDGSLINEDTKHFTVK